MLVSALTTGHKIGLGVVAATFVIFALASSFLFPRFRSTFPGRGLPAFIIVSLVFFFGMLAAVEVFGAEPKEKREAEGKQEVAEPTTETTTTPTRNTPGTASTTSPIEGTTTSAKPKTASKPKAQTIGVTETEFKITVASKTVKAGPITFDAKNAGKVPHDLVVVGNGVSDKTPVFNAGQSETLKVDLKPGTYELYCSVPGHKQAGMDTHITVSK